MSVAERLVVLVAFEQAELLDIAGPADVFDGASRLLAQDGGDAGYRLVVATPDGRAVRTSCGIRIAADAALGDIDPRTVDTLLVSGGLFLAATEPDRRLIDPIRRIAAHARRTCSVCTGAFLLGAAGLLDGRRATTHWAGCAELERRFTGVQMEPDRIFVRDGPIATSAGVTAGMDLALALVEEDHGPELTRTIARWLVMFVQRPGGQSQFSEWLNMPVAPDSPIRAIVDAIVADPASDHRISELAARAALSERHLARMFTEQTRTTPARFVERVRVEAARNLLESDRIGVEAVAARCGFGTAETMRRAFLRVLGVGPAEYRHRFRSTNQSAMPRWEAA